MANPNWTKGKSGNPGGRPKILQEVRDLARTHTVEAIRGLVTLARDDNAHSGARVAAWREVLDRGWGKPDQTHHHDGDVRQHIISDRPLTDEEWAKKYCRPDVPAVVVAREEAKAWPSSTPSTEKH